MLLLTGKWWEAAALLETIASGTDSYISEGFFHSVVKTGHTAEVLGILERNGADERWRPLYEAMRAVRAGSAEYFNRVAPEVAGPAREILGRVAPGLGV